MSRIVKPTAAGLPAAGLTAAHLTSDSVLEYIVDVLTQHLTFVQHSGRDWRTEDVWRVLVAASGDATTIETACASWQAGPDANTLRGCVRACVTNERIGEIEEAVNAALAEQLPRRLWRGALETAYDLHDEPYYGRADHDLSAEQAYIARGEAERGTTRFYRCATAYVVHGADGLRLTLALTFAQRGDTPGDLLKRLRQRLHGLHLREKRVYLDKAFSGIPTVRYLIAEGVSAIIAAPIKGKATGRGLRAVCHGHSRRTEHTFSSAQHGELCVPICLVRTWQRRRNGKRKWMGLAYIVLRCGATPDVIRQLYRRRFGIESSYRLLEQVRAMTTSPCSAWRFLFLALAALLITLWVILRWRHTALVSAGRHRLHEALFRLSRFTAFLLNALRRLYRPLEQIAVYR